MGALDLDKQESGKGASGDVFSGTLFGLAAYLIWGLAPIYWKMLHGLPPLEIIAHRVVWSLLFLSGVLTVQGRWPEFRNIFSSRKALGILALTTFLISSNWFIFVYAVITDRVLQTSLGYFMNPMVNVLLGFAVLGERLRKAQMVAVVLAAAGVIYLGFQGRGIPWISLALAFSFGFYGLCHKLAKVPAVPGLTMETLFLSAPSLAFLLFAAQHGHNGFIGAESGTMLVIACSGLVTSVPLICFGLAVRRISLTAIGFLQYLAPSSTFLLGILVYREPFSRAQLVAFACIWTALVIFSVEGILASRKRRRAVPAPIP